jgi:hypothetical protein
VSTSYLHDSYSDIVTPQKQPTFLETVLPTLKHRLFTAFLNRGSGGFYTFGYIPDFYPESSLTWVNSTSDWSTTITGLAIGNRSNMISTSLGPILDTGTPFLLLPPDYCVDYYSYLDSFQMGSYHDESGFIYPCNATTRFVFANWRIHCNDQRRTAFGS